MASDDLGILRNLQKSGPQLTLFRDGWIHHVDMCPGTVSKARSNSLMEGLVFINKVLNLAFWLGYPVSHSWARHG